MGLDSLPLEILRIVLRHLDYGEYEKPTTPLQMMQLGATSRLFRDLVYSEIFKITELTAAISSDLNVTLEKYDTYFQLVCILKQFSTTTVPLSIMKYVQELTLDDTHETLELNGALIPAYQLVRPEYLPSLKHLKLSSALDDTMDWLRVHLFRYSTPVKISIALQMGRDFTLPDINDDIAPLITSLHTLVPSRCNFPEEFEDIWINIRKMSHLDSLYVCLEDFPTLHLGLADDVLHDLDQPYPNVADTLYSLSHLRTLRMGAYPITLSTNLPWAPKSLTCLECTSNAFIPDPNGPETDVAEPSHFATVSSLTMDLKPPLKCTRLPFRNLTKVDLICDEVEFFESTKGVKMVVQNLICDNPFLESFSSVITWDFDIALITHTHMQSLKKMSLSFFPEISGMPLTNNSLFSEVLQAVTLLTSLSTLGLRVPISQTPLFLISHDDFVRFAYSSKQLKKLSFCIQLIDVRNFDERLPVSFARGSYNKRDFLKYLPIEGIATGVAGNYFNVKDCRVSYRYNESWSITFEFDLDRFRQDFSKRQRVLA